MGNWYSTHTFRVVNKLGVTITCSVQNLDYPDGVPETFSVVAGNASAWTVAYGNSVIAVTCAVPNRCDSDNDGDTSDTSDTGDESNVDENVRAKGTYKTLQILEDVSIYDELELYVIPPHLEEALQCPAETEPETNDSDA